jgi:hypothetical protein
MKEKVRAPTQADIGKIRDAITSRVIPARSKEYLLRTAVPMRNLMDLAKEYLPPEMVDAYDSAIKGRQNREKELLSLVRRTVNQISAFLKGAPDKLNTFNDVRLLGTLFQIDLRKPESYYSKWRFYYDELNADGTIKRRVRKAFNTEADRTVAIELHEQRRGNGATKARREPAPDQFTVDMYRRLKPMYESLGADGKAAYARALGMFEDMHIATSKALKARIDALLSEQDATVRRSVFDRIHEKILAGQITDGYQPLQRNGSYWIAYTAKDPFLGEVERYKESFASESDRQARITELERIRDEDGVQISQFDSYNSRFSRGAQRVPLQFAADVLATVKSSGQMTPELEQKLTDLIFDASPERSFVQAYRARKKAREDGMYTGVRGFLGDIAPGTTGLTRKDTIHMLQTKGYDSARSLAAMEYSVQEEQLKRQSQEYTDTYTNRNLSKGWQEASRESSIARMYKNLLDEYIDAAKRRYGPLSTGATGMTYAMTLGLNISSAILSLANLPIVAAPYLASQYGGMGKVVRSMGNAHRVLFGSGKTRNVPMFDETGELVEGQERGEVFDYSLENYDFADPKNANIRHMRYLQEEMRQQNMFQQSYTNELLDAKGAIGTMQTLFAKSGIFQHLTENMARQVTAISAFQLEAQKIAKEAGHNDVNRLSEDQLQSAAREAAYISELTNGSVTSTGAPLLAQHGFTRLVYLYKRHPLAMFNMLAQTLRRSKIFQAPPKSDPDYEAKMSDIRIARMQFVSIMGSFALFSGAQGVPLFATIAAMYNLFAEDDEDDFETLMRTGIGELGYNGILNYAFGVDVASRIGLSGSFYRESFNRDAPWLFQQVEALGGPVLGLLLRAERVPNLLAEGDYERAIETALPTSFGNIFRGVRYYTDGINTLRGDPIVGDVTPYSAIAQAFGFMPSDYLLQLEQNNVGRRMDQAISARRVRLLRELYTARRQGDRAGFRETLQDIRRFNREQLQRGNRDAFIGPETISNSLSSHERTTQRMHHGVLFSATNERYIRQVLGEWGVP